MRWIRRRAHFPVGDYAAARRLVAECAERGVAAVFLTYPRDEGVVVIMDEPVEIGGVDG